MNVFFPQMWQSCFKSMQRLLQFSQILASSPSSVFHFIKCSWAHASRALSGELDSLLSENAFYWPFQKIFSLPFLDLDSIIPHKLFLRCPITHKSRRYKTGIRSFNLDLIKSVIWSVAWHLQQVFQNRISTVSRSNDIWQHAETQWWAF